ncbi:MAG: TonB-dependent receptor [Candidatus Marinimicrobia bacterium]|nr:TonB-dependent receptor [Candidatus Neomarinimicrobiota bacterium]
MQKLFTLGLINLLLTMGLLAQQGDIVGFVIDKETRAPLVGVNVIVEGTDYGAATNRDGKYKILNIPAGSYNLKFQMIGYKGVEKVQVPVNPDRATRMDVELASSTIEGEEVVVTGKTFVKPLDATVSDMNLDFPEMMNDAGSAMDVQRMMQALPSVVTGSDQNNHIIVRGGNQGENLFLIDNIEIPNPNHFGWQGTGGGPISMIDPLFIEEVDFYAGAFPARFGGKASSVMNIKFKEGSREHFHSKMDMGMSGIGLNVNGPINSGQGSYMFSAHKSYLDLIVNSIGLTAVPQYSNFHGKIVYDLNKNHKLTWNGMYGIDHIYIKEGDNDEKDMEGTEIVDNNGSTYATGLTLRSIFNENSYSLLTFSRVGKIWQTDVKEKMADNSNELIYQENNFEGEWTLKGDYFQRINARNSYRVGFNLKAIQFNTDEWAEKDTVWRYYYHQTGDPQTVVSFPGVGYSDTQYDYAKDEILYIHPQHNIDEKITTYKPSIFLQYKFKPFEKMEITSGLRFSYFDYSSQSYMSPRLGITYHLTPATSLNFGYGKHYQEPPYNLFTRNLKKNQDLKSYSSQQFVLGLEHFFTESMKASLEIYHKNYQNYPVDRQWSEGDSIDYYKGEYISQKEGRSRGIEIFLQKKKVKNFHFSLSYSHYISEYRDVRKPDEPWYTGTYDFRDVLTFISGYKIDMRQKRWYRNIKKKQWWKYMEWLISPGDEFEVGLRFRYNQGRPYTEPFYDPYLRDWYTKETTKLNTERLPAYHRLDIMIKRRWIFKKSALVMYIDLMNSYNRKNVWNYSYKNNGEKEEVYQYLFTPVGGFVWEF